MSETASALPKNRIFSRTDPQHLAWGILLLFFALFCIVCVLVGLGVNAFLFQSSVPITSLLTVSRGPVISQSLDRIGFVTDELLLTNNTNISTTSSAQGTILFTDEARDDSLILSATLRNNASLVLRRAQRPRFDWSTNAYLVDFQNVSGELDVMIADNLPRDTLVILETAQGALIHLTASGTYKLDISDSLVRVDNLDGAVTLIPPDRINGRVIPPEEQGVLLIESGEIFQYPGYKNLLRNSNFDELGRNVGTGNSQELLDGWVCRNDRDVVEDPIGSYRSEMADGRMTLRLERFDGATSHGQTSCAQTFGQSALNVSAYDELILRATFNIHYQSLNACGVRGSECPIMLRLEYTNSNKEGLFWVRGFYTAIDPQLRHPLLCDSCQQEHERISQNTWYTFETDNLKSFFPPGEEVESIVGIWFYASGHQYDVQVSEIALLARETR